MKGEAQSRSHPRLTGFVSVRCRVGPVRLGNRIYLGWRGSFYYHITVPPVLMS